MRLSDEIVALDDERYKDRNVLAELKYCGREIKHRKTVTNDDLRFMAWLCRSAADLKVTNEGEKNENKRRKDYNKMNEVNIVTVRWFDGYLEEFEATEVRFGSDLLWLRLKDGKNRHIPLRSVRWFGMSKESHQA